MSSFQKVITERPEQTTIIVIINSKKLLSIITKHYTTIPPKIKRVIFRLTHGFIGGYFKYTHMMAEDVLKEL